MVSNRAGTIHKAERHLMIFIFPFDYWFQFTMPYDVFRSCCTYTAAPSALTGFASATAISLAVKACWTIAPATFKASLFRLPSCSMLAITATSEAIWSAHGGGP